MFPSVYLTNPLTSACGQAIVLQISSPSVDKTRNVSTLSKLRKLRTTGTLSKIPKLSMLSSSSKPRKLSQLRELGIRCVSYVRQVRECSSAWPTRQTRPTLQMRPRLFFFWWDKMNRSPVYWTSSPKVGTHAK